MESGDAIEGHAKVHLEIGDDDRIHAAYVSVLAFKGFEKLVQGMQVELMPALMTRVLTHYAGSHPTTRGRA